MAALILTIKLMFAVVVGMGTVFTSHDIYNPNPTLACTGKILNDRELIVAHRNLPCGSKVTVCNPRTNLCTVARVLDRGPFGKTHGEYTSALDMSSGVANKIKHNGLEPIVLIYNLPTNEPKPKRKRYIRNNS